MRMPISAAAEAVGRGFLVGSLVLGLAACAGDVAVRGNMPDAEVIAEIEPGLDTREDVVDKLGSPSTVSTFQDRKWYYVGQKSKQLAFFRPEIIERSVLVVSFDGTGLVDDTVLYTLEDGRVITPVGYVTPTEGKELTILQQFFGNFGRFPTDQLSDE